MPSQEDNSMPLKRVSIPLGGLHIAALWALALLQPLLSLLGSNPEFFNARDNTSAQIIIFVLGLAILPPLAATAVEYVVNFISEKSRWILHLAICGVLFAAIALQILKQFASGPAWPMIFVAILLGGLLTWAYMKSKFMRSMADILIIAPPVILVSFFFFSDTSKLITSNANVTAMEVKATDPAPVVMVIFDEFPITSLMTPDGEINPKRFPNFAALKNTSDWYQNTATSASYTGIAVPAIMSGMDADRDKLPTASDHPNNLFTLLGKQWKTQAIEPITQLCPEDVCRQPEGESQSMTSALRSLATDLKAVSAHLILPADMGSSLPDISQSFEGFGKTANDGVDRGRARQWVRDRVDAGELSLDSDANLSLFLENMGTKGETFDFLHIQKPHYPWIHAPSGIKYAKGSDDFRSFITYTADWLGNEYLSDRARQGQIFEVGYTDILLGQIIDEMKKQDRWKDSLFVVTSDHGSALTPEKNRREAEPETLGQIGMVPLFIKAPGQTSGEVIKTPTCSIEIVPKVADILGIELPWEPTPCDRNKVTLDNGTGPEVTKTFDETLAQRQEVLDRNQALFGGQGENWDRAFRWGEGKSLIGKPVSGLTMEADDGSSASSAIGGAKAYTFDPSQPFNPVLRAKGSVDGLDEGAPLAVSVNGRIVAVGLTYADKDKTNYSILLPQSVMKPGQNELVVYEITGTSSLRPLWSSADQ